MKTLMAWGNHDKGKDVYDRQADDSQREVSGYAPVNILFDGPPGPESGRFVEVETDDGKSIRLGEWIEREDGLWALRITELPRA